MCSTLIFIVLFASSLKIVSMEINRDSQSTTTPKVLTFVSMINVEFSNDRQVRNDFIRASDKHDNITMQFQQMHVPFLQPAIAMNYRQLTNSQGTRHYMVAISETKRGNIVGKMYSFKKPFSDFDPLTLEAKDFSTDGSCTFIFKEIEPAVFFGTWQNCEDVNQENPGMYNTVVTCNKISGTTPKRNNREKFNRVPYSLNLKQRFELSPEILEEHDDFKLPCA